MPGTTLAVVGFALYTGGCGPTLVGAGADIAASGLQSGTTSVAGGSNPQAGAAVAVGAGAALMYAGYKLTPPDQRQSVAPAGVIGPQPAQAPNAPPAQGRQLP